MSSKSFKTEHAQGLFIRLREDAKNINVQKYDNSIMINFWSDSVPKNKNEFGRECSFGVSGKYEYIGQVGSANLKSTGLTKADLAGLNKDWAIIVEVI